MFSFDWHNVPMSDRKPRVTRNDCGEFVIITTHHVNGSESVGIVQRDAYGLPPMRKGE